MEESGYAGKLQGAAGYERKCESHGGDGGSKWRGSREEVCDSNGGRADVSLCSEKGR